MRFHLIHVSFDMSSRKILRGPKLLRRKFIISTNLSDWLSYALTQIADHFDHFRRQFYSYSDSRTKI